MSKREILDEIRRTAAENDGEPLGRSGFSEATGIPTGAWYGKYWARWGDALQEAGFSPNELQRAYSEEFVIDKLIELIKDLDHFPVAAELRMRAREDDAFPSHNVFERIGRKRDPNSDGDPAVRRARRVGACARDLPQSAPEGTPWAEGA